MTCLGLATRGTHSWGLFKDGSQVCVWCGNPRFGREMVAGDIIPEWVWEVSCTPCNCDDCKPLWPFVTQFSVI